MNRKNDTADKIPCKVDRYLHTGTFSAFKTIYLSDLVFAFFGIGFYRFWYQFNFYNLHFSTDMGIVTVGANIARIAMIFILVLLTYKAGFSHATQGVFLWSGFVLMTLSSLLYLLDLFFGGTQFEPFRIIIGGIGLVGGEIIWIFFLERLKPGEILFYASGGLALSCILSLVMGYMDTVVAGMINLFIPAFSVFSYWRAMPELDRRNAAHDMRGPYIANESDCLYDEAPLSTGVKQVTLAFFLYALLLGMASGYPDGNLRELSQGMRSVHQILVVLLISFIIWLVLVKGYSFQLPGYWLFQNILMMFSICLLMSGWSHSKELSTFLLTNAMTCFYIPLVIFIIFIGRHVHWPTTLVYAVLYGGSLLLMALGRLIVYAVGPHLDHGFWLLIIMTILVLIESTLILRPQFMGDFLVGFELGHPVVVQPVEQKPKAEVNLFSTFVGAYGLTETEQAIVSLMAQGRSRSFIAHDLNYSENTIRNYTRTIYQKVGVHSKQELLDVMLVKFDNEP